MPITLPAVLRIAKNEIASIHPWLFLIDLVLPTGAHYRFVHNTEDITFQGNVYSRCPFQIELPDLSAEGNIPSWTIRVANVMRTLEPVLQEYKGIVDSDVTITIVNSNYLSENYVDLQTKLIVLSTSADVLWVTFTCGGRNLFGDIWPPYRFLASMCRWRFRWHECAYVDPAASVVKASDNNDYVCYRDNIGSADTQPLAGSNWRQYWRRKDRKNAGGSGASWALNSTYTAGSETCKNTLADCRAKANEKRYGGFPGLNQYGVKIA